MLCLGAEYWQECAELLSRSGDAVGARSATLLRGRAGERAKQHPVPAGDWLSRALDGWRHWARDALDDIIADNREDDVGEDDEAHPLRRVDRVQRLISRLAGWNDPSHVLADAHRAAARLHDPGDEQSRVHIALHLGEALGGYAALNCTEDAAACRRALGTLTANG